MGTAGAKSGRMRDHALSSRATSQTCSARLAALWCLSDTMSASLCLRPTSSPSMPPASHQATFKTKYDHVKSNQDHVTKPPTCNTFLKTSDFSLFLIRSYRLFAGSKRTSIGRPGYISWYLPRHFARSKVLCLHQIVRIQSNGINCAT